MTLLEFLYISFPFGIATSATIRVGNLLGAGRPHEARVAGDRPRLSSYSHADLHVSCPLPRFCAWFGNTVLIFSRLSVCCAVLCFCAGSGRTLVNLQHHVCFTCIRMWRDCPVSTDTKPCFINTCFINNASHAGIICIAIGTGFLAVAAVIILVFRNSIGYLFVDSADVAAVVASICPIAAAYQIPDGVLGTIGGVLRCFCVRKRHNCNRHAAVCASPGMIVLYV